MEITTELIRTIYDRAEQYAIAKYGEKTYRVQLLDDGSISLVFGCSRYGEWEESSDEIEAKMLSADLDELAKQRKEEEEKQRIETLRIQEENRIRDEKRRKEQRRIEFINLKKEFEP
jgi:hypothetical protein